VRIKIFWHNKNTNMCNCLEGRDSLVGIAISYRLDGPVVARFSEPAQTGLGAHPVSYTKGTVSSPRVKRLGRGIDHSFPSSVEVKEE
jgi:hypothetical protein